MSSVDFNFLQEDEDVIIEGSDLHKALIDMGYTNFDSIPKMKMELESLDIDLPITNKYQMLSQNINDKINLTFQYILQENELRKMQLRVILESNVLLDDHANIVNNFLTDTQISQWRKFLGWIPFIGSCVTTTYYALFLKKKSITAAVGISIMYGFSTYINLKHWIAVKNLRYLVTLQNELHNLLKQSLKILRRTYGRKSIITEAHEKHELLGSEKYDVVIQMKQLLLEIFINLSNAYYQKASEILNILPESLHTICVLTKIEFKNEVINNDKQYEELKSWYYTFILAQSELMFIIANAYNGKAQNNSYRIPETRLSQFVKRLTRLLNVYYSKMSVIMKLYQSCEIEPIQRVFRGIPCSKWQDTYIHLDLTSQRLQLAYKAIMCILEAIDGQLERDEDSLQLTELITDNMNEVYKQIENARSSAEFSSLLIAKAQHKPISTLAVENENDSLFPDNADKRNVVIIDKDPEIEDEVFEEYIMEEYLKPLYENSDLDIVQNYKLDKLLAKNFMSELKEVLIEKQKSMSERELKALKRMYDSVRGDINYIKTEPEKPVKIDKPIDPPSIPTPPPRPPLPPPPPPPPPILKSAVIVENNTKLEEKNYRTPVPLPRVKMLQSSNEIPYTQQFSIRECTPHFKFPSFKIEEETFLGSGENSEEENVESSSENENTIDN